MTCRVRNRLTAVQVQNLKAPGKYADGGGLYLVIDTNGRKRWAFFYTRARRRCELGLGRAQDVSLASARSRAAEYREALANGQDPKTLKHDAARTVTFGDYADEYVEAMKPSWRNAKHADQWVMTLTKYAAPLRRKLIHEITTDDVVKVLKPRWSTTPETADRLRGRIENVLDSAKALGLRDGDNPARWRGHLDQILPRRRALGRGHHAALSFERLPDFMSELAERDAIAARALEFAILTAGRTGEVLGVRWEEIDLPNALWTVPAERMKAGQEHRVPLSNQAIEVLERPMRQDRTGLVFSKHERRKPLSIMAMAMLLRRMDAAVTVHGFRSTFRDWAAEVTNFPNEVCEMALAHAIPGKTEAAYRRGDLFLKRRRLMEQWGRFCVGATDEGAVLETGKLPESLHLAAEERETLISLLSNARCALCGSGWGDPCRTADDVPLEWHRSHDRRFMRLVEDWALATDQDLASALLTARAGGQTSKATVVKLELARRSLTPAAWTDYLAASSP